MPASSNMFGGVAAIDISREQAARRSVVTDVGILGDLTARVKR